MNFEVDPAKGFWWTIIIWIIACILYFGWKRIKEKRREVNYIDAFKSLKKKK